MTTSSTRTGIPDCHRHTSNIGFEPSPLYYPEQRDFRTDSLRTLCLHHVESPRRIWETLVSQYDNEMIPAEWITWITVDL